MLARGEEDLEWGVEEEDDSISYRCGTNGSSTSCIPLTLLLYVSPEIVTNKNPGKAVPGLNEFNVGSKWI